ncbi:MAG: aminotransferase class I/II-fold pyridoxal phosphate-dependent enzyme [Acidimicrobiia bacterium]|nr:aminotransferase class I/II-fold pyridoxal phosphate-dependent enzyme [Acidimicrobiia bacterium]
MPPEMVEPITRLAQNLFICPPVLSQHAAIAAFDATDELEDNVRRYARNRQIVLAGLAEAGLTDVAPADGAFHAWVNIESLNLTSTELSARWLRDISVAVTPGLDFDGTDGDRHIRISDAESTADIGEAMGRIVEWVGQRSQI